jgi:hypothetical protein
MAKKSLFKDRTRTSVIWCSQPLMLWLSKCSLLPAVGGAEREILSGFY